MAIETAARDRPPPQCFQQDYFLLQFLRLAGDGIMRLAVDQGVPVPLANAVHESIFNCLPTGETQAVRILIRTLAGREDFARINAHHSRRKLDPLMGSERVKRSCLFCLMTGAGVVEDSEWHSFLDCALVTSARDRFLLSTKTLQRFFPASRAPPLPPLPLPLPL